MSASEQGTGTANTPDVTGTAPPLGIAILPGRGGEGLAARLDSIAGSVVGPCRLLVALDHPTEAARSACAERGVQLLEGDGRGFAWLANGALFGLLHAGCAAILLLREDAVPDLPGWDETWRVATAAFGCVAAAPSGFATIARRGTGTALDPFSGPPTDWQALAVSATLLEQAGFLETGIAEAAGRARYLMRARNARRALAGRLPLPGLTGGLLYIQGGLAPHQARRIRLDSPPDGGPQASRVLPWGSAAERKALLAALDAIGLTTPGRPPADPARSRRADRLDTVPALRAALEHALATQGGFMIAGGWLESVASSLPVDAGEVVPALNHAVLGLLRDKVRPGLRVLDWSAGPGTLWWVMRGCGTVAVAADEARAEALGSLFAGLPLRLVTRLAGDAAASVPADAGSFDLVLADGPQRAAAAKASLPRLSEAGVLILPDPESASNAAAAAEIEAAGFRRLNLAAPAPGSVRITRAAFFYRPDNCLGL